MVFPQHFADFLFFPIVYSFYLSFRETTLYSNWFDQFSDMHFVGLGNYSYLVGDSLTFAGEILHGPERLLVKPIRFLSVILYPGAPQ